MPKHKQNWFKTGEAQQKGKSEHQTVTGFVLKDNTDKRSTQI